MPKNKRRRRRIQKAIICLFLLFFIAAAVLLLATAARFLFPLASPPAEKQQLLTELKGISTDTDLVTVEVKGNTALISCVTSGLDTASMRVTAYDLSAAKPLSEPAFPADNWEIGLTDNGFYAISVSQKTVYLYGNNGHLRETRRFDSTPAWSSACGISADEGSLLHAVLNDGTLYLRSLDGQTATKVSHTYPSIEILGFENGAFYLKSNIGDLFTLSPNSSSLQTVWSDRRCTTVTPYYGMGTATGGFLLTAADKTAQISTRTAEETLIGNGKTGFATAGKNGNTLYIYDLSKQLVSELQTAAPAESACFMPDGQLLLVTGDPAARKHQLFLCDPTLAAQSSFSMTESPRTTKPPTAVQQQAKPAYSSKIIKGVPLIHQFPAFPTGCESVSAVMLTQRAGASVTVDSFVDNYLEKSAAFYSKDGKSYGPDPYQYFLGSPRSTASYGCMAPVIEMPCSNTTVRLTMLSTPPAPTFPPFAGSISTTTCR